MASNASRGLSGVQLNGHNSNQNFEHGAEDFEEISRIAFLSNEQLRDKASAKEILILEYFLVQFAITGTQSHIGTDEPDEHNDLHALFVDIKETLHSLFLYIAQCGCEADNRNQTDQASLIYTRLLLAWHGVSELCDDRKRLTLLKIANFFQKTNAIYEAENILAKLARISTSLKFPVDQSPGHLLARSFLTTSDAVRYSLGNAWKRRYGLVEVPPNLAIPPLQRALFHPNPIVASTVFASSTASISTVDAFNQQALHVAAANGSMEILNMYIRAGVPVDAPDIYHRTALFLAGASGRADACLALLQAKADTTIRDVYGHTILEVAARGGHFSTVQHLLAPPFTAEVNPNCFYGASSPLQAAIDSGHEILSKYLFEHGANPYEVRFLNGKVANAIDLAEERGWTSLVSAMRQYQAPDFSMDCF
ncbi:Ankyrin-2 [Xylographa pallens]|nr:Ankyrin-2 [Xylographa pallens]